MGIFDTFKRKQQPARGRKQAPRGGAGVGKGQAQSGLRRLFGEVKRRSR